VYEYGNESWNSSERGVTKVVRNLIIANVAIFFSLLLLNWIFGRHNQDLRYDQMARLLGFVPEKALEQGYLWQFLTYGFIHDKGVLHILFNMYVLWWAGAEVERYLGSREFIWHYLMAVVAATFLYLPWAYLSGQSSVAMVGASGAIMSLLAVYATAFPDRQIYLLVFGPFRARTLVLLLMAIDLAIVLGGESSVAGAAHLGGAVFGFAYMRMRGGVAAYFEELERRYESRQRDQSRNLRLDLDRVLRRLNDVGMEALTREERAILNRASKHFRDRPEP